MPQIDVHVLIVLKKKCHNGGLDVFDDHQHVITIQTIWCYLSHTQLTTQTGQLHIIYSQYILDYRARSSHFMKICLHATSMQNHSHNTIHGSGVLQCHQLGAERTVPLCMFAAANLWRRSFAFVWTPDASVLGRWPSRWITYNTWCSPSNFHRAARIAAWRTS